MGVDDHGKTTNRAAGAFVLGDCQASLPRTGGSGKAYVTGACLVAAAIPSWYQDCLPSETGFVLACVCTQMRPLFPSSGVLGLGNRPGLGQADFFPNLIATPLKLADIRLEFLLR